MTVLITLTTAGADTGPFNLYSDVDGYTSPFETNISKASLLSGYTSVLVPDTATQIKVQSVSTFCENFIFIGITTTTTTTTVDCSCKNYDFENLSESQTALINYTLCDGTEVLAEEVPPGVTNSHCCRVGTPVIIIGDELNIAIIDDCGSWC